jgi:RimJ/RimL family protein N-acetyltransferase
MGRYTELVEAFADSARRNAAIVELVGAINAGDLRRVQVSPEARAALVAGLDHPNAKVRWWCLQLMDHLADESYLEPILSKLSDPVAKVRRHAIHALSCAACKPNRQALEVEIEAALRDVVASDPDEKVREEARRALAALGSSRASIVRAAEELPVVPLDGELRVSFDGQPTLSGTLVELRPLRPEDYDDLYAVAADPLVWEQHPVKNRHEEPCFREFFAESLASGGALLATHAETRRTIGSSRFHGYSEERSEVEIGWTFLARSYWGGRYNGELKQLMLRHAFRFVNSVVFFVSPENIRSQRAVEKIGGVLEPESDEKGRLVYRITASSFASSDGRPESSSR